MLHTRVLKPKFQRLFYSPVSSAFSSILQRRFNSAFPAQKLGFDIENLKEPLAEVFDAPYFKYFSWVGIYDPSSWGQETKPGHFNFLVGLRPKATLENLEECRIEPDKHLKHILTKGQTFHFQYMLYQRCTDFKIARALLGAQTTIYQSDPVWLPAHQSMALKEIVRARTRLEDLLRLESEIAKHVALMSIKNWTYQDRSFIIPLMELLSQLYRGLPKEDRFTKSLIHNFRSSFQWRERARRLVRKTDISGVRRFSPEDRKDLADLITNELPTQMRMLRNIHIPILNRMVAHAQTQVTKSLKGKQDYNRAFGYWGTI